MFLMDKKLEAIEAVEPKEITLTCKGMSCVNWDCGEDFEFVFSEDKACHVDSVLAEFLSPKIARIRRCDIGFTVYTFKHACSEFFNVFQALVSCLVSGSALLIEKSNFAALFRLSQELENSELLSSLLGMLKPESLSLEDAFSLWSVGIELGTAFCDRFENLTDFLASHFYEIQKESFDFEPLELLLSSPSLQIEDEDSLYGFVRSRSESDLRFASLFEFVYFNYLSDDSITDFVYFMSKNYLDLMNSGIWRQIVQRLSLETKSVTNPRALLGTKFAYNGSTLSEFDGIIAHLTRECGGNVHDNGIVNITSSSVYTTGDKHSYHPKNAADFETEAFFGSNGDTNAWICYDFKDRVVIPTSYSLRTYWRGPGGYHLRCWVIEVSNDEKSWTEIDRRENDNYLNGCKASKNYKISRIPGEGFRFFRLRQTGDNHKGNSFLNITSLEIFGTLL